MQADFSKMVAAVGKPQTRSAGETLFAKGEPGDVLYFVLDGEVQVRVGDLVLETVRGGGIVGEMVVLDDTEHVRSATAVALTDCQVLPVGRQQLIELAREHPALPFDIARTIVHRLRAMNFLMQHDPLTRLPNRSLFQESCNAALGRAERRGGSFSLLCLDLDNFTEINGLLGNGGGDELLRLAGERLRCAIHELDVIARLGEDEFAVLLEDQSNSAGIAATLEMLLQELARPYSVRGQEVYVTATAGVSCYPQDGGDSETLLRNAQAAMRVAKDRGRNGFNFFSAELQSIANEALRLRKHLRQAIARNEFVLNFQPRVALGTRRIVAVEALLRWRHPELGMVPPGKFIPVAEQAGLIEEIGEWVLRAACAQQKAWLDAGNAPARMAVNLSARQLRRPDLHQRVAAILEATGLAPQALELEITESAVMDDPARTVHILKELRRMGVAVALDDFGTEYSSLGYLKQFPLDCMKIDQCFVRGIPKAADDVAITMAIVTLGKNLGLKIVAEGIETEPQCDFLTGLRCDEGQGYLFSRPVAAADLTPLLAKAALA